MKAAFLSVEAEAIVAERYVPAALLDVLDERGPVRVRKEFAWTRGDDGELA
ncbi:MAG TPA: hypothetical protein VM580_31685 [Labilithrix sp.]|jgi:hypothetical protein|nr:hypothetical protein [Labilithrix sp.]